MGHDVHKLENKKYNNFKIYLYQLVTFSRNQ